jgi:hypothetical protein
MEAGLIGIKRANDKAHFSSMVESGKSFSRRGMGDKTGMFRAAYPASQKHG